MKKDKMEALYEQVKEKNGRMPNVDFINDFDKALYQYTVASSVLDMWEGHKEYLQLLEEKEENEYRALEHANKELSGEYGKGKEGAVDLLKLLEQKLEDYLGDEKITEEDMKLFYRIQKKVEDVADNVNLYV